MRPALPLALLLIAAAPAPTPQQVQDSERARAALLQSQRAAQSRAATAIAEERRLAQERVAAAASLRGLETQSAAAADHVAELASRRVDIQTQIAEREAAMAPFLPLIQRLALYPAETLLAVPMPPEQAVRGLIVLGGLTRQLEADAAALRAQQAELARIQAQLDAASTDLAARQASQARQAAALDAAIDAARIQRRTAEGEAADWSKRAAAEAARADSLRAAIARIEADRIAAEARQAAEAKLTEARQAAEARLTEARQAAEAKARALASAPATLPADPPKPRQEAASRPAGGPFSTLVVPVAGRQVRGYGEAEDGGPSSGIAYQVPPSARVVSPCGGRVVFSGPFRSFGQLMIVDCGGGWHVVLSGFDRIDAQLGQTVQAGEPVGAMPGWNPLDLLRRPLLNLELRRDGAPTNPQPFFRAAG